MRTTLPTLLMLLSLGCSATDPAKTWDPLEPTAVATAAPEPSATTPLPTTTAEPSASASASTPTTPPAEPGPPLDYAGLRITPVKPAKLKKLEIKPDGSIIADGEPVGTFVAHELHDEEGDVVFRVFKDGSVEAEGPGMDGKTASFNEANELIIPDGKVGIGADGTYGFERTGGGKPSKLPLKFSGVTEKNRRAAVLLGTYLFLLTGPGQAAPPPSSPPPSGAPPVKKPDEKKAP